MQYTPYSQRKYIEIKELIGLVFAEVTGEKGGDAITFKTTEGRTFIMCHYQDCCESVSIEDITGDVRTWLANPS